MQHLKAGRHAALAFALLCAGAPLVHAQQVMVEAGEKFAVPFMSGGIGQAEAAAMRKAGRDFDLRVEFSERQDNDFVADADLQVTDMSGAAVFTLADAGPIVNVELPAGQYRVASSWHGQTESRLVQLDGKSGQDLFFHWQGGPQGTPIVQLQGDSND
jgi:hypothetical protein